MAGHARRADSSSRDDLAAMTEFVRGSRAASSKAKTDTATAVVAGVLSAALFSRRKKR